MNAHNVKPSVKGIKIKKPTRKQLILQMLKDPTTKLTCTEMTKRIIARQKLTGNNAYYLSGSISSILNKLVKEGVLQYADEKGIRGGYKYQKA